MSLEFVHSRLQNEDFIFVLKTMLMDPKILKECLMKNGKLLQ